MLGRVEILVILGVLVLIFDLDWVICTILAVLVIWARGQLNPQQQQQQSLNQTQLGTSQSPPPPVVPNQPQLQPQPIPTNIPALIRTKVTRIRSPNPGNPLARSPVRTTTAPQPPPAATLQTPVPAAPSAPPNWTEFLAQASVQIQNPFLKTPVPPNSAEYREIEKLFGSGITQLDRVLNPELWKRFVRSRSDLLGSKSEDFNLLAELGLSATEIAHKRHVTLNFDKTHLNGSPYCDNMVLLFHGSRGGADAVDKILSQGLDDRLGAGGTFGRGIYFADDPKKAMQYDTSGVLFVCAVTLGDCLNVQDEGAVVPVGRTTTAAVREPEKGVTQKRNPQDLFFDSIVGRRSGGCGANEYVIFNRYHCCPLYAVTYTKSWVRRSWHWIWKGSSSKGLDDARLQLPSFSWSTKQAERQEKNPFYASTIFQAMFPISQNRNQIPAAMIASAPTISLARRDRFGEVNRQGSVEENSRIALSTQLRQLAEMGFKNKAENERLLRLLEFDMEQAIDHLLVSQTRPTGSVQASGSENRIRHRSSSVPIAPSAPQEARHGLLPQAQSQSKPPTAVNGKEECLICAVEYQSEAVKTPENVTLKSRSWWWWGKSTNIGPGNWETLHCGHKLCTACAAQIRTTRTTMSGQSHTFLKCPFCQSTSGIQIGDCPNGTMTVTRLPDAPTGYTCGSLSIRYSVQLLNRIGYLPDNPEGRSVLDLLRIAWDRRLIFTVGTSATTGASNVLVWNIHHKTALSGGERAYGYPDPTYLLRVGQELAQVGVP